MEAWNVSKVEYIDGSCEFTVALDKPFFPKKRDEFRVDDAVRSGRLDVTPFGLSRGEITDFQLERNAERSKSESVRRTKKHVEVLGRANHWDYFVTITFRDDVAGHDYTVAAELIERWLHALKGRYPKIEWLLVMEMGEKNRRWHAHALVRGDKLRLVDSGKSTKGKHRQAIFNMPIEWPYGFSTVTHVRSASAAGMYISKYIGKAFGEVPRGKKRYWASRTLKRLEDIRVTYLFDQFELKEWFFALQGVADKVTFVKCEASGRRLAYVKMRGCDAQTDDIGLAQIS